MADTRQNEEGGRQRTKTRRRHVPVRDLPQRQGDTRQVTGGSTSLMLACASGQHIKEATLNPGLRSN